MRPTIFSSVNLFFTSNLLLHRIGLQSQARGKDKKPRQMHPNSLGNLRPAPRFTTAKRPCKKSKLTDDQLNEAIKLREYGFPWRLLGDRYGVSHDTLRLAIRDKGTKCHIGR